jgi:hypothetical protein
VPAKVKGDHATPGTRQNIHPARRSPALAYVRTEAVNEKNRLPFAFINESDVDPAT